MYIGPEILPALTFWRLNAEEEGPSGILGCVYTVCSQLLFLDFLWSSAIHMSIIDKTFDCLLWNLVSSQITLPCLQPFASRKVLPPSSCLHFRTTLLHRKRQRYLIFVIGPESNTDSSYYIIKERLAKTIDVGHVCFLQL